MSEMCNNMHRLFNNMKRFSFPFDRNKIPENGIYIMFEKGEKAHGGDRIVRVGTNKGNNQLRSRLFQHFINENKDRSVFRKNIGRALLNKDNDSFLKQWDIDLTTKKSREEHSHKIDFEKQKQIEKRVTSTIQERFSFVVFEVPDKSKRIKIETRIISTVSLCNQCAPSEKWLGLFSPKAKIRESGLWLVNGLYKEPLQEEDFREFHNLK